MLSVVNDAGGQDFWRRMLLIFLSLGLRCISRTAVVLTTLSHSRIRLNYGNVVIGMAPLTPRANVQRCLEAECPNCGATSENPGKDSRFGTLE